MKFKTACMSDKGNRSIKRKPMYDTTKNMLSSKFNNMIIGESFN